MKQVQIIPNFRINNKRLNWNSNYVILFSIHYCLSKQYSLSKCKDGMIKKRRGKKQGLPLAQDHCSKAEYSIEGKIKRAFFYKN